MEFKGTFYIMSVNEELGKQRKILRVVSLILLSTVMFFFVVSQIITYTDILDYLNYDGLDVKLTRLATTFLLIGFLIANGSYEFYLDKSKTRKKLQVQLGVFLASLMIMKILTLYSLSLQKLELWNDFTLSDEVRAENNILNAKSRYSMHGQIIEYYDLNKTKRKFEPSQEYIETYRQKQVYIHDLNRTPFYITTIFVFLILSFYLSIVIAERTAKRREHNKN